jgi:hypothetical protein
MVVHVVSIVLIDNINVVIFVPVVSPIVRPRVNQAKPKAVVLEAWEAANNHKRLVVDDEPVVRAKIAVVAIVRDTITVVATALLPRAVVGLPVL